MDDENGLDLTLSLPCGGPSSNLKGNNNASGSEEADRGSKLIDDFKNFLDGGNHKEDSKPDENLFYDLSKATPNVDSSSNINKRKHLFDEINNQKRHERDAYLAGLHVKTRTPHASINTDEDSTAENEDVADSEADGSTSKLVQHHNDGSKCKEICGVSDRFTISSDKEFKVGSFSGQSGNILNMPNSVVPVMTTASNDRPGNQQPVIPANLPLMFSYSSIEAGKSEGLVSHPSQFQPSYFGRGLPNSNKQNDGLKITQATMPVNTPNPFEGAKGDTTKEEGPSTQPECDTKGTNGTDQSKADTCPPEYPSIRPGISAELKFGGSGTSPNLPWVSTTGPGPNGKTISGVTYRFSGTQIRIVCACHGSHMSPEEFVHHANEEQPNPIPFPNNNNNPAASAQN